MEWLKTSLRATAVWVDDFICNLAADNVANTEAYLLAAMVERLDYLTKATPSGQNLTITPYTLSGSSQLILDKDTLERVRNVAIWVDSAVDGPAPTIRIGTSNASSGAGVRINPGQVNELGNVPADTTLYAASDVSITLYLIARF